MRIGNRRGSERLWCPISRPALHRHRERRERGGSDELYGHRSGCDRSTLSGNSSMHVAVRSRDCGQRRHCRGPLGLRTMKRRLTPYVLLSLLMLGTGLGIGLGLVEAPSATTYGVTTRLE